MESPTPEPAEPASESPTAEPERLLAVCLGQPRVVEWRGETIETAIFKAPTEGPAAVGPGGLDGDGQADLSVHGGPDKAVHAYDESNAVHWAAALGRDEIAPGGFGENLRVSGWPEARVRIGDRFEIGSARLEVSQPRQPCMKLGMRFDDPRFPKRFLASGRVGYYLRVLDGGRIEAGDGMRRIETDERGLDVASLVALWLDRRASRDALARAVEVPALAEAWRTPLRERLDRLASS